LPLRLLLIDDDPESRLLARRALACELPDLEIEEVGSRAALEAALEAQDFDAVITDYQLEWSDGLSVLNQVKARCPGCVILMFTNTGNEEVAVEAMKAGLDDYVLKLPGRHAWLPVALRAALDRNTLRRELEAERVLRLEREKEAREAAESASQMKDEFLAILSHELRTPLNAIVGWAALLRTGGLQGERFVRAVDSIERNARAQSRLIEDLLDVSAIIFGKLSLDTRPMDLVPVVEAALDVVRPAAEAKGVRLESALTAGAGPVSGDPDRLQQVVWNLLSNAVKFTPRGGAVRLTLAPVDSAARLTVCDDGPGIDPVFLPYVFEPFRQGSGATNRSHSGLGLGLAIVKRLVEMHGGEVRAEPGIPGEGARFVVDLPVQEVLPERRAGAAEARWSLGMDCPPGLGGLRVLVVDDEPDTRELVATILGECGVRVRAVASADEALREMERFRPQVLVSDISMPGRDGYDLIQTLRALPAADGGRIPAVALTAHARAEDRRRSFLAGFDLHVAKPVDPAELLVVVATLGKQVERRDR
jgi:signal transduction histidine kinase